MWLIKISVCLVVLVCLRACGLAQDLDSTDNMLLLELEHGTVTIRMRPDVAPAHVKRIKRLAREKFYDGIIFHRVIDGFMAQTGDPTGTGRGGSKYRDLKSEFSTLEFVRGTLGMARSAHPDSANSQFFIMFADGPWLNGEYTIWGEVVDGMMAVDQIRRGSPPDHPDKIISLKVMPNNGD